MNIRPAFLAVPILGILLAFVIPFEPARPGIKKKKRGAPAAAQVGGVWSNAAFLKEHMENALRVAKEATGKGYVTEPQVRIGNVNDVGAFLAADMDAAFRKLGAPDDAGVRQMGAALAKQVVAAFDPATNEIHVLPENAVAAAAATSDNTLAPEVLRLVLVRMAIIAMDRQLYPEWKAALDQAPDMDAVNAAGAVLEGHAQYETQRIAEHWAQHENFPEDAFDRLVFLLTAEGAGGDATLAGEAKFAILEGHAFMKVAAQHKRRGGIVKALKTPPTTRNAIFDPASFWKAPPKGPSAAAGKVIAEFEALLPTEAPWSRAEAPQAKDDLAPWFEGIPEAHYAGVLADFKSGQRWTATHADDGVRRSVLLLEFRRAGQAEAFVNIAKGAAPARGMKLDEGGAGRDGGRPGFSGARETGEGDAKRTERSQVTYQGKRVLIWLSDDATLTRDMEDDALEAAADILGDAGGSHGSRRRK